MRRFAELCLVCMLALGGVFTFGQTPAPSPSSQAAAQPAEMKMEMLCRPTQGKVEAARKINTLKLCDGKLYIGHGDQGVNTGPTDILYYDMTSGKTVKAGIVDDEAIERYRDLDGILVIPGVDAMEDWSFGNCYTLEGGKWLKHRTIPGSIHVWDIVSYRGRWYVGTHACFGFAWGPKDQVNGKPGAGMIMSSGDHGKTWRFEYSPAVDTNVDSFTRNLVVFQDKLYAFVDAQTFPNTKEFTAKSGGAKPLDDPFSSMDTLVYDGDIWKAVDLIKEPGVRQVLPIPTPKTLGLYVQFSDRNVLYKYDGKSARKTDFGCDAVLSILPKADSTYLLIRRDGRYLQAETADCVDWKETLLSKTIGQPLSIECQDRTLFVGTSDGTVWKGMLP